MHYGWSRSTTLMLLITGFMALEPSAAQAQNSSLLQNPSPDFFTPSTILPPSTGQFAAATPESGVVIAPQPMSAPHLAVGSWTYTPPAPPRVLKLHDVVSIRVDEMARMTSEGRATQRKNGLYDAVLKDWVTTEGLKAVRKAAQSSGDPQVNAQVNESYRATSDLQTRESLAFSIAAEIADIRPNGTIVLEAHKTITVNDNRWEVSLSGLCQSTDIGPDNVILSRDILHLEINKNESGQTRDGYRRGWLNRWFSKIQPF